MSSLAGRQLTNIQLSVKSGSQYGILALNEILSLKKAACSGAKLLGCSKNGALFVFLSRRRIKLEGWSITVVALAPSAFAATIFLRALSAFTLLIALSPVASRPVTVW